MRARICRWLVCVSVACAAVAPAVAQAAPQGSPEERLKRAQELLARGEHDQARAAIEEGLAIAPKDLELLGLKAKLLVELRDYSGALAVYQAYLDAGPSSGNRRNVLKIIDDLSVVKSTFLDVTATNGPAVIYLDSRTRGELCKAEPTCSKALLPGDYQVIAERPGFERWTERVTITANETAKVSVTLVEKPSQLTVRAPAGARVTVDGATYDAAATVAAGKHQIVVSLDAHKDKTVEIEAREGEPVDIEVVLTPLPAARPAPTSPPAPPDDKRSDISRNRPLFAFGVALGAAGLGTQLLIRSREIAPDRPARAVEAFGANMAFAVAGASVVAGVFLWLGERKSSVIVAPRADLHRGISGIDLALRF
jgi:PEGA domain/Tetratricopeptide repeat